MTTTDTFTPVRVKTFADVQVGDTVRMINGWAQVTDIVHNPEDGMVESFNGENFSKITYKYVSHPPANIPTTRYVYSADTVQFESL